MGITGKLSTRSIQLCDFIQHLNIFILGILEDPLDQTSHLKLLDLQKYEIIQYIGEGIAPSPYHSIFIMPCLDVFS